MDITTNLTVEPERNFYLKEIEEDDENFTVEKKL